MRILLQVVLLAIVLSSCAKRTGMIMPSYDPQKEERVTVELFTLVNPQSAMVVIVETAIFQDRMFLLITEVICGKLPETLSNYQAVDMMPAFPAGHKFKLGDRMVVALSAKSVEGKPVLVVDDYKTLEKR